jgi:hypothetical protein
MVDYFMESIHDLLSNSESISDSNSCEGSHVSSASDSGETLKRSPCVQLQEG